MSRAWQLAQIVPVDKKKGSATAMQCWRVSLLQLIFFCAANLHKLAAKDLPPQYIY